jgi:hypothetical protein
MSAKQGGMHDTLLPSTLSGNCVPEDKEISDLLDDERPIAMWHVYFKGCNTAEPEESTGQTELEAPKDVSWEVSVHC